MSELIHYGFYHEGEKSVQDVVKNVEDVINRNSNGLIGEEMEEFLKELELIKQQVEANEVAFYQKCLKVNTYEEAREKLKSIQDAYAPLLAQGKAIWEIRKQIDFDNVADAINPEELREGIQDYLTEFLDENEGEKRRLLERALEEAVDTSSRGQTVAKFLQKYLRDADKEGRFILSRGGRQVGLGKIVVGYDEKTGRFEIITEGVQFSPGFKKRLEQVLKNLIDLNKAQKSNKRTVKKGAKSLSPTDFRSLVNKIALGCIVDAEAKSYVQDAMRKKSQFDLMPNLSSVIGYLGEIRAVAMLNQLSPQSQTKGTGKLRMVAQNSPEIPIDVLCESYGFQVKNYTLKNNTVTFDNTLQAPNMLADRMHLSGTLYDILINLFGVYQYNQPFVFSEGRNKTEPPLLKEYTDMYNEIGGTDGLLYQLSPIFDSRIPHMLKMAETFSVANNKDFRNKQVYFNTFYWINRVLVPSSMILEKLITQLRNNPNNFISARYTFSTPLTAPTLQHERKYSGTVEEVASNIRMSYYVTIDLSDLM